MASSTQQRPPEALSGERIASLFQAVSVATVLPTVASAGIDSSPVVVPIVISFLTIVPFVFYAQALKPKERTVKQVELDENLRPVDKKLKKGRTGEARVGKNK